MKKIILIGLCLVLSFLLAYYGPTLTKEKQHVPETVLANERSLLQQQVFSYSEEPISVYKLYNGQDLVAVVTDYDALQERIAKEYEENYAAEYPGTSLGLGGELFFVKENVSYRVEDIDDQIFDYLLKDNHLGVTVTAIELSTKSGTYDVIYVKNIDDFYAARDRFLKNFVAEEALTRFRNREVAEELTDYGTIETGVRIQETITTQKAVASRDQIFNDTATIYEYLCYGRETQREYYTVKEGDTLAGVGSYYHDMSPRQLMLINPDIITNVDQILEPGMSINVAYYTSPLTVVVTKERLSQEVIYPDTPEYIEDPNIFVGTEEVITEEVNGLKNVLREETWINGVLQPHEDIRSSVVTLEPVRAVIRVGTKPLPKVGTGRFIWPIDNPIITCAVGCYYGHMGTDVQNMYDRYGPVYAADNGTVIQKGFNGISGNYLVIDHNNGFTTYYGHFNVPPYVEIGDTVQRGQVIGQIGMTGLATGPHVHFEIRDGSTTNACEFMDCHSIPWAY